MLKTNILVLTAVLLFQFFHVAPVFGQGANLNPETAKIKANLTKLGTEEKSKVKIQLRDKRVIKGYLAELNAEDFVVVSLKTNDRTTIVYGDVTKVSKSGFSLGAKLGIAALAVGAVAAIIIVVGVKNLDDNIFPN